MAERRRAQERLRLKIEQQRKLQDQLTKVLDVDHRWWGDPDSEFDNEETSDEEEDGDKEDRDLYVSP